MRHGLTEFYTLCSDWKTAQFLLKNNSNEIHISKTHSNIEIF